MSRVLLSDPDLDDAVNKALNPELEVDLYRIAQEDVTNILRHAQANELTVLLISQTDTVSLQINDNGVGFEPQQVLNNSFGLIGMQERCDRGTKIIVAITFYNKHKTYIWLRVITRRAKSTTISTTDSKSYRHFNPNIVYCILLFG